MTHRLPLNVQLQPWLCGSLDNIHRRGLFLWRGMKVDADINLSGVRRSKCCCLRDDNMKTSLQNTLSKCTYV